MRDNYWNFCFLIMKKNPPFSVCFDFAKRKSFRWCVKRVSCQTHLCHQFGLSTNYYNRFIACSFCDFSTVLFAPLFYVHFLSFSSFLSFLFIAFIFPTTAVVIVDVVLRPFIIIIIAVAVCCYEASFNRNLLFTYTLTW